MRGSPLRIQLQESLCPVSRIGVDPCGRIADAIGARGQRIFYLQAYRDERTITVLIERRNYNRLPSVSNNSFHRSVSKTPILKAAGDFSEEHMHPQRVDPLFRAGEIGLAYDKDRDRVVVFTKELLLPKKEDPDSMRRSVFGQAGARSA
ncbi:DUF3090 family protein [Candidatus Villigracilis saccharophilus]|uniref:DUF3090 family protein n=1 Tax=Candidatus Villigracilis saccharophilus TaxID=3140684 RepID=UPI0031F19E67